MVKKTSQLILSSTAAIAFIAVILPQPVEAARQGAQGQARTSVNKPTSAQGRSAGGNTARAGSAEARGRDNTARAGNNAARDGGSTARAGSNQASNRQVDGSRNVNNVQGGNRNNNVNIDNSRNVNVNADGGHGGGYYNDNHHHNGYDNPLAAAAVVTATVALTAAAVGSIVNPNQMPSNCVQVMQNNTAYMQCGSTWYQPQYQGSSVNYVVVNQPY